jgi:hypothetical protein
MASHAYDLSTWEDQEFKAILGYIGRPCLKKEKRKKEQQKALTRNCNFFKQMNK